MRFLRENRRFSFLLGGVNAWELPFKQEIAENGNELASLKRRVKTC
ncbi:MAG: hypothetical protein SPH68_05880 [Candidatus Borkfalkiaceae bacterium]|nr:hypothetical protein [Clostridia bacterium]MDY6223670.1 hypothetical protein [Christensenellaceae bacterium]